MCLGFLQLFLGRLEMDLMSLGLLQLCPGRSDKDSMRWGHSQDNYRDCNCLHRHSDRKGSFYIHFRSRAAARYSNTRGNNCDDCGGDGDVDSRNSAPTEAEQRWQKR